VKGKIMRTLLLAALILGASPVFAQSLTGSQPWTTSNTVIATTVTNGPEIAVIDMTTGDVKIDWDATTVVAANPSADPYLRDCAKLMLAIRNGTWKPLH
jgi:uncharacterized protein YggE